MTDMGGNGPALSIMINPTAFLKSSQTTKRWKSEPGFKWKNKEFGIYCQAWLFSIEKMKIQAVMGKSSF